MQTRALLPNLDQSVTDQAIAARASLGTMTDGEDDVAGFYIQWVVALGFAAGYLIASQNSSDSAPAGANRLVSGNNLRQIGRAAH